MAEILIKNKDGEDLYPKTKAELVEGLKTVAISGSYKDLTDTPAASGITYEDLNEDVTINPTPIREEWEAFRDSINALISGYQAQVNTLQAELNKVKSVRYVVETWVDGTEWYTVYSDGWCEQGGDLTISSTEQTKEFFKSYISNPQIYIGKVTTRNGAGYEGEFYPRSRTLTSFKYLTNTSNVTGYYWFAQGYIS